MTIWSNPPSPSADCTLYWLRTAEVRAALPLARRWLDPDEAERASRFVFDKHRDDFLASRLLTRGVLAAYVGEPPERLAFTRNAAGKPALAGAGGEPAFSLSHSHGICALLVATGGPLGVDIENPQPARADLAIAEHYFDPREYRWILLAPDARLRYRRFLALWTLKEATLKAEGSGLGLGLDAVAVTLEDDGQARFLALPPSLRDTPLQGGLLNLDDDLVCAWVRVGPASATPPRTVRLRLQEERLPTSVSDRAAWLDATLSRA